MIMLPPRQSGKSMGGGDIRGFDGSAAIADGMRCAVRAKAVEGELTAPSAALQEWGRTDVFSQRSRLHAACSLALICRFADAWNRRPCGSPQIAILERHALASGAMPLPAGRRYQVGRSRCHTTGIHRPISEVSEQRHGTTFPSLLMARSIICILARRQPQVSTTRSQRCGTKPVQMATLERDLPASAHRVRHGPAHTGMRPPRAPMAA